MRTLLRDLRSAGGFAMFVAVSVVVMLTAGVVAAAVQAGQGGAAKAANRQVASQLGHGWIEVDDPKVGFRAMLPRRPTDARRGAAGQLFTAWRADAGHRIVIERIPVPDLSSGALTHVFREAIDSLASGSGFQVVSQTATTFRNQLGRVGVYVRDDGSQYKVMIFIDGAGDLYMIAAPTQYFDRIMASFQVLVPSNRPLRQ